MRVVLVLGARQAALAVDGRPLAGSARPAGGALAAAIALGPRHTGPSASTGYLDIDLVTVRVAP
jgi:hypothetical protein